MELAEADGQRDELRHQVEGPSGFVNGGSESIALL